MRNEKTEKKIQTKLSLWILLLLLIAVLAIVAIICINHSVENIPPSQADSAENSDKDSASTGSVVPEDSTRPEATQESTAEMDSSETHPPVVIVQKADAEYEKWLSAAMVVCVSMEYPDFELENTTLTTATIPYQTIYNFTDENRSKMENKKAVGTEEFIAEIRKTLEATL